MDKVSAHVAYQTKYLAVYVPYWYLISGVFNFAFFVIVKKIAKLNTRKYKSNLGENLSTRNSNYRKKYYYVIATIYAVYVSTNTQIAN